MSEQLIQDKLKGFLSTPRYMLKNLFVFGWESDLLFLSTSGYWYELEIKISRPDFLGDVKNKQDKHRILRNPEGEKCPNYFYYAVPEDMVKVDEVPEYAGLVYVSDYGFHQVVKKATCLHRKKFSPEDLRLADKFYYNMQSALSAALVARRELELNNEPYRDGWNAGARTAISRSLSVFSSFCPYREERTDGTHGTEGYCTVRNRWLSDNRCLDGLCDWMGGISDRIDTLVDMDKKKMEKQKK